MHVETSFVRNLGDLTRARSLVPGRFRKATSRTLNMHVGEKSDWAIVPKKRTTANRIDAAARLCVRTAAA